MADVRCPMCGRPNPAELETCVYCQARLKPLVNPQPPQPAKPFISPEPEDGEQDPSWLTSLREFAPPESKSDQPADSTEEQAEDTANPPEPEQSGEPLEQQGETYPEEQAQDWLSSIRKRTEEDGLLSEPPLGVANLGAALHPEADDWLKSLRDNRPASSDFTDESPETNGDNEPNDWLSRISELKASEVNREPESGWIQEFPAEPAELETPQAENPPQPPLSDQVDELSAIFSETPAPGEAETSNNEDTGSSEPAVLASQEVHSVDAAEETFEAEEESPETPELEPEPELPAAQGPEWEPGWAPDWLAELEAKAPPVDTSKYDSDTPLVLSSSEKSSATEMPDWLQDLNSAKARKPEPEEDITPGEAGAQEFAAPAEIPTWVQAMRPIETVAPLPSAKPEREDRVEEQGPLAGLKGILPSEPSAVDFHHTSLHATQLDITERQQANSDILQSLIASETQPLPLPEKTAAPTQRILRLAIALVLLLGVLVPIIANTQIAPLPESIPQEVSWANEAIDSLSDGDPVLLVADYSPALAGELEAASAGVVDHLMARGARIALISTSPTGPALASRLFDQVYQQPETYMAAYLAGQKLVNLGYLPGGLAGLAAFISQPQTSAFFDVNNQPAWSSPALQGVTSLEGFAQIVLLTDNVDVGRAWLEQVRAHEGNDAPVVLVTSAQAAPIMRAYLDSGQIQGMVTGLVGGMAYDQIRMRPSLGRGYWDAYQAGILIAILAIVCGGLYYAITPYLEGQKEQEEVPA